MLRAYDKATGKEVGAVYMPAPQSGSPMTYMVNGRQYIVVAVSGGNYSGEYIAFRVPSVQQTQPTAAATPAAQPTVMDGVYTEVQAKSGQALYSQNCATCHGLMLQGSEEGPPLSGDQFVASWKGSTAVDLFDRIRQTMPADDPGKLSRQEDADVVAHILSVWKAPAGKGELPADAAELKKIKLDMPSK